MYENIFEGNVFTSIDCFCKFKFEILSEEEEEIDIEAITYFDEVRDLSTWSNKTLSDNQREILIKIRQLTKAVKQLNDRMKPTIAMAEKEIMER